MGIETDRLHSPERERTEKYALISVFDKRGLGDFAKILNALGYRIISTGGTATTLNVDRIPIVPVQEITGNPESFDGRMKTISFKIESGILYDRDNPSHVMQVEVLGVKPIDIVVCNLYPFEQTVSDPKVSIEKAVENIDVGGPTMVRAAAKNFKHVLVIVDPGDYQRIAEVLQTNTLTLELRRELAAKAFAHLAFYDAQIARFLGEGEMPEELTLPVRRMQQLRYGENPHQKAFLYLEPNTGSQLKNLIRIGGRELSLVNVTDINAGIESVRLFDTPAAVVIKHNSPCGIALGDTPAESLARAIGSDPESAFGGVIVLNQGMDLDSARVIASFKDEWQGNIDIVAVPEIADYAIEILKTVRTSMGIYTFGQIPIIPKSKISIKPVDGGFVLQTADFDIEGGFPKWEVVTVLQPSEKQLEQMKIAWKFISRIRSNAVIVVDEDLPMTRGIGTGQTSRVRSTRIALEQASRHSRAAILASDSFFPFDDSVKLAAEYGIGAIVQQGGSIYDKASIEAANQAKIPMVLTHRRAFWH